MPKSKEAMAWSGTDRWQKSADGSHIFLHFLPTSLNAFGLGGKLGGADSDHVGLQESGAVWFRVAGVVYIPRAPSTGGGDAQRLDPSET